MTDYCTGCGDLVPLENVGFDWCLKYECAVYYDPASPCGQPFKDDNCLEAVDEL